MSDKIAIEEFIRKNRPRFKKWEKHLNDFDWSEQTKLLFIEEEDATKSGKYYDYEIEFDNKRNEFKVQVGLVKKILDRLKFFIDKTKGDYKDPKFRNFYKLSTDIVKIHIDRCDNYSLYIDETDIKILDLRSKEADFNSSVFSEYSKTEATLAAYGFVEEEDKSADTIEFFDNKVASLAVYQEVCKVYPVFRNKMKAMKIDFKSPPKQEMHITNDKAPKWDKDKHFWEQDKKTIQYYADELKKIEYGIKVDGVYIDGWLYYHINHFRTSIPSNIEVNGELRNRDVIIQPPLRDNEWLIADYFNKARKDKGYALVAATRRAAKTTLNASRVERAKVLGRRQVLVAGGSSTDLGQIVDNCKTNADNCEPAFELHHLGEDDKGGEEWGIRTKDNKRRRHTTVYFKNLEGGVTKRKGETLAGFTPDEFILDEAFKFPFMNQLQSLRSALFGEGVFRAIPIITATGGDTDLAADGIKMLSNPESNDVTLMDWEQLERGVEEEYKTWKPIPFGLFLPGQMSTVYSEKRNQTLAEYLDLCPKQHPSLHKIQIKVTDWQTSLKNIQERREAIAHDKPAYVKELAYHPIDPTEIFLSGKINPFPVAEAKKHREFLVQTGMWDARYDMIRNPRTGSIETSKSGKELLPFPYTKKGDAPFLLFELPPKEKVPFGTYTAGFDDYKQEDSDTDSVGTFYVWKNEIIGDKFSKKIVASLSARPEKHSTLHSKWLLLMEAYQIERTCFGENEDFKIKDYLDKLHLTDKYLAASIDFTQSFNLSDNRKRTYGWTPRATKRFLFEEFVEYCNEEFEIEMEDGETVLVKGVQRIDDIYLLDEIINYQEKGNYDRIIGAMGGLGYIHYLNVSKIWSPSRHKRREENKNIKKRPFIRPTYGALPKRRR